MLEQESHKTMRSHAYLASVSKARAVVIFVDFVVVTLERKPRTREASKVPKMTGRCLA